MLSINPTSRDGASRARALVAIAVALTVLAGLQAWALIRFQPLGLDFLPLWTAGRMAWAHPASIYDFAAVTTAQGWLLPRLAWLRPYAYPPTALLLLAPFGLLPFWPALTLWLASSLGLFLGAGVRLGREHRGLGAALMALSPAVVPAIIAGQTVLLVTGFSIVAVIELKRRPRLAGALLGVAAAIKPQMLMLAPLALIASGEAAALVSAAVAIAVLFAASVCAFGPASWTAWLSILGPFEKVVSLTPGLGPGVITPSGAARELGLPPLAADTVGAISVLFAAGLVWRCWSRSASSERRLATLLGASLLATPYAMYYDGSVLVPSAVFLAVNHLGDRSWGARLIALLAALEVTAPYVGVLLVVFYLALTEFHIPRTAGGEQLGGVDVEPAPAATRV